MNTEENPIQLIASPTPNYAYYANINGIIKSSIGCYFDENGKLVSTTLYKTGKYQTILDKIMLQIEQRGVVFPSSQ
jgi:hypothetical protein